MFSCLLTNSSVKSTQLIVKEASFEESNSTLVRFLVLSPPRKRGGVRGGERSRLPLPPPPLRLRRGGENCKKIRSTKPTPKSLVQFRRSPLQRFCALASLLPSLRLFAIVLRKPPQLSANGTRRVVMLSRESPPDPIWIEESSHVQETSRWLRILEQ